MKLVKTDLHAKPIVDAKGTAGAAAVPASLGAAGAAAAAAIP
jgi:hypothetical protein